MRETSRPVRPSLVYSILVLARLPDVMSSLGESTEAREDAMKRCIQRAAGRYHGVAILMQFGVHNPSWVYGPEPMDIFDGIRAKAQWAENNGFVWFSVMDHLIQIGGVGAPTEPFMEGWTVLSGLAAVTNRIRLATLASS